MKEIVCERTQTAFEAGVNLETSLVNMTALQSCVNAAGIPTEGSIPFTI